MASLVKVDTLPNGDTVITSPQISKRERASDGTWRTLYSYDNGESWAMNPRRLAARMKKAEKLHPGYLDRVTEPALTGKVARQPEPMLMQMPERHGEQRTRDRAKRPRRLRERDVRMAKPHLVHTHRCHGSQYSCACDTPYFKRPCGGSQCLYKNGLVGMIDELSKATNARRFQ